MQNIKGFFLSLLLLTINLTGMESSFAKIVSQSSPAMADRSELKQRLVTSNQPDVENLLEQSTVEDCSICYEEKEVALIPCKMGEKHPKICSICLDGCNEKCPYCRENLITDKKHNCIAHAFYNYCYSSDRLCLGISGGCLYMYFYMIFASFA